MKKILKSILNKFGYIIIKKDILKSNLSVGLLKKYNLSDYDLANARGAAHLGLENLLKEQNKLKWLDVGSGGRADDGFNYIDIVDFPIGKEPKNYVKFNIVTCTPEELKSLGKYDFIRMQHVFEHFTPEDGLRVLNNCAEILNVDGYLLLSCPDIDIVINSYQNGSIRKLNGNWGVERFDDKAPDSFYFSIFTHSILKEPHLWCYNSEGLIYQIETAGRFKNIERLELSDDRSCIPFTHNRPSQDIVVLAQKK